jgi:hypothetical protein
VTVTRKQHLVGSKKDVLIVDRVWRRTFDSAWSTERSSSGHGHGVLTLFTGCVRVRRLLEVFGPLLPSCDASSVVLE